LIFKFDLMAYAKWNEEIILLYRLVTDEKAKGKEKKIWSVFEENFGSLRIYLWNPTKRMTDPSSKMCLKLVFISK